MKLNIPPPVKEVLIACGYDNCYVIRTIGEADIDHFTDEIRKGKVPNLFKGKEQMLKNFEFNRGQRKLFVAIATFVQKTFEVDGIDGFSLRTPKRKFGLNEIMLHAPRKKTRNTISDPFDRTTQDEDPIKSYRSNLLRLVVEQLVTETGKLFSEVSISISH